MVQVMTGDGWLSSIGRPLIMRDASNVFFFITFFLITSLVLTNVVIAVLLDKFVAPDADALSPEAIQIEKVRNICLITVDIIICQLKFNL